MAAGDRVLPGVVQPDRQASLTDGPHAGHVGANHADVGAIPTAPHALDADDFTDLAGTNDAAVDQMDAGGRIEQKWYRNRNGSRRLYYVIRFERKHSDGTRYRPMRYIGINPPTGAAIDIDSVARSGPHVGPHVVPHAREEPGASPHA